MEPLLFLGGSGLAAVLHAICHQRRGFLIQLRLHLRDRADRKLATHIFDQTRSTQGLEGYVQLIEARRDGRGP